MADAPKPKQNNLRTALLSFGSVALMLAALAGGKQVLGASAGEHCDQTNDVFTCKWGSVCIGRACYRTCSNDGDCPASWHCGKTDVTVETQNTFSKDERADTERICFAPKGASKS
jgi:hypothetical protein